MPLMACTVVLDLTCCEQVYELFGGVSGQLEHPPEGAGADEGADEGAELEEL